MQKVVEGILVNFETVGKGRQKLVILPGWKAGAGEWMNVAKRLAEKYSVYVLELPGMGGSGLPPQSWGIRDYAKFTEKFCDKLEIKKCVLLGHSFGGRVGILLAANTNLIEKLVLVDAAGMEIKSAKEKLMEMVQPVGGLMPESWKNKLRSKDYQQAGEMRKVFSRIVNEPLREELEKVKIPTLIVWGERDKVLGLSEAQMIKRGIKNSILRIVWGAGHWPHIEKYEELIDILTEEEV